jgi:hypothetical protein
MTSLNVSTHDRSRLRPLTTCAIAIALAAGAFAACGPTSEGSKVYGNEGGGAGAGTVGAAGAGGNVGGVGGVGGNGGNGVGGVGGGIDFDSSTGTDAAGGKNCGAVSVEVQKVTKEETITEEIKELARADVFIMFDQSQSMDIMEGSSSRWSAVTQATIGFLQSPESAGLHVGIGYFGRGAVGADDCLVSVYAQPEVAIAALPGNAMALVNSINRHRPLSETPTAAALTGAIQHAKDWQTRNPMTKVFVLLVTDGEPNVAFSSVNPLTTCAGLTQDVAGTVAAAQAGASGMPPIKTFVLGVGPSLANLNQIAVAGQTNQAYLISGGNVAQQVITALNTIRGTISKTVTKTVTKTVPVPLDCEWVMPAAMGTRDQDPEKVNVNFLTGGAVTQLGKVGSQADCANFQNAWYYDDPVKPTKLIACPNTCDTIKASTDGKIDILVGCDSIPPPL